MFRCGLTTPRMLSGSKRTYEFSVGIKMFNRKYRLYQHLHVPSFFVLTGPYLLVVHVAWGGGMGWP